MAQHNVAPHNAAQDDTNNAMQHDDLKCTMKCGFLSSTFLSNIWGVVLKQNLRKNCFRWLFPTLTFRLSDSGFRCINRTSRTGIVITQPVADHGWTQAYCWLTHLNAACHIIIYTDIPAAAPYIKYFAQWLGVKIALDCQTNTTTAFMRV